MARFKEFREEQRFPAWVFMLLGIFALVGVLLVVVSNSNIFLLILVAALAIFLPVLLVLMKLVIETTPDGVHVLFPPFINRVIRYDEIQSVLAKTYSPNREYGGWGIRGFGKRVAYNTRGNEGVLVTLKSDATIMLGSQRAAELQTAIQSSLPKL